MIVRTSTRGFASVLICLALAMAGCPSDDDEASTTDTGDGGTQKLAADSGIEERGTDSSVAVESDAGDGAGHLGHHPSTDGGEVDASSTGGGGKDSGSASEGGSSVTFKIDGDSITATSCDYVGKRPGDATGSVFGTTFLCRMGVGGLPSIGVSFPEDAAAGTTVMCDGTAPKVALTLGAADSSVYSSAGSTCSITVTTHGAGAGDALVGTFSATLKKIAGSGPDTVEITDGAFDLTRVD